MNSPSAWKARTRITARRQIPRCPDRLPGGSSSGSGRRRGGGSGRSRSRHRHRRLGAGSRRASAACSAGDPATAACRWTGVVAVRAELRHGRPARARRRASEAGGTLSAAARRQRRHDPAGCCSLPTPSPWPSPRQPQCCCARRKALGIGRRSRYLRRPAGGFPRGLRNSARARRRAAALRDFLERASHASARPSQPRFDGVRVARSRRWRALARLAGRDDGAFARTAAAGNAAPAARPRRPSRRCASCATTQCRSLLQGGAHLRVPVAGHAGLPA